MAVVAAGFALAGLLPGPARAQQMTPEEHAKHHPGTAQPNAPPTIPPSNATAPANPTPTGVAQPGSSSTTPPAGPMSSGMGDMMKLMGGMSGEMEHMKAGGTLPLFPSLMDLPNLPPEKRDALQREAHDRMKAGAAVLSDGLDRLSRALPGNDYAAMQDATARMHEGLEQFESGLAGHRALVEGQPPRQVALGWFKSQMDLPTASASSGAGGLFGLPWFHDLVMVVLIAFAAAMIGMYFFKMRRAALLLQGLTGAGPALSTAVTGRASLAAIAPASATAESSAPSSSPSAPSKGKWSGLLRVGRIFQETPDVKTFRLMNPLGGVLPFDFLPGQFLTVTVAPDGKPVRRGYTVASSPTQHDYAEITVKHEEGGVVSGYLHDHVKEGDQLACSGPSGSFIFTGRECKCILLIGGGVGITPMMSVLRYLTDRSWPGDIYLLYGIHSPQDFIFREELEYLRRRHPNLRVAVTVSHPEGTDWKGPTGRISKELIAQSVPDLASRYVHLCGPVSLMEAVKKALIELGAPAGRIKTEAFGPALGKPEPTRPQAAPPAGAEGEAARLALPTVTFSQSDKSAPLPPDKVILDVADEIGVEIDNSCRVGTCGVCRVKLLSGQVTMAVEDGLEPGDKENNIILACQARSTGNVVVEA
jgi:ferredoxin-NADP reductase